MATTASMSQRLGRLEVNADPAGDEIVVGRTAAGELLVDGGATRIKGGKTNVANTDLVNVLGSSADDRVAVDLTNGAMPLVEVSGGAGQDLVTLLGGADEVLVGDLTGSGVGRVEVQFGGDGATDILGVAGTAAADRIVVTVVGGQATVSGASVAVVARGVEAADRFFVDAGDGADLIDASGIAQRADMLGFGGDDTLLGGAGNDALQSMDGNDLVRGGGGDDLVSMADGDDRALWSVGDGSDVVSGGAGSDRFEASGSALADVFNLTAQGGGAALGHGGLATAQRIDGVETLRIAAGDGADRITIGDLAGTGVGRVEIDLGVDLFADRVAIAGLVGGPVFAGDARVYTTNAGVQVIVTGFDLGLDAVTLLG
jgi:RTX calcium-binding nonapeptide repeat (4 copies)